MGTHNSYHREIFLAERPIFEKYVPNPGNYYYSHARLADQLSHQGVRSLEIDLHSDSKGSLYATPLLLDLANISYAIDPVMLQPGIKVFHVTDADQGSVCKVI